jgi:MarC family membrane protein
VEFSFASTLVILLAVTDPIGNIPVFISVLRRVDPARRARVILRECLIAYAVLVAFAFFGDSILSVLSVSYRSLNIAGGVILFLIAIRMVFRTAEALFGELPGEEPLIVPLAIPSIAGPGAIATVVLLVSRAPDRMSESIAAITIAIAVSMLTLGFAERLSSLLGERVLTALERLIGLLLTTLAVEMLLRGVETFIRELGTGS